MPTFHDPILDGAEASEALRGLAHATRDLAHPADTYPVLGDLLAGVRSLRQVLDQLAHTHLRFRAVAHDDDGNHLSAPTKPSRRPTTCTRPARCWMRSNRG